MTRKHRNSTAPQSRHRLSLTTSSTQQWRGVEQITFSAKAWIKLQTFCHSCDTEIGAFGIASDDDLLYIEDIVPLKQQCSEVSVEFDDDAVADFFEDQVQAGRRPSQFARVWIHTHPGHSANPSVTDEETFQRVFGACSWAVMFILARNGATYCRIRTGEVAGPTKSVLITTQLAVAVDYESLGESIGAYPVEAWRQEIAQKVEPIHIAPLLTNATALADAPGSPNHQHSFLDLDDLDLLDEHQWRAEMESYGLDPSDLDESVDSVHECAADSPANAESEDDHDH